MTTAADIAADNDRFRRLARGMVSPLGAPAPMRVLYTRGVAALFDDRNAAKQAAELLAAVINFDTFTEDNDPHGEHDLGKVTCGDTDYLWKIEYYDSEDCQYGGDPYASPVYRVLTIMRADEY